jgi:hypothetical protein
MAGSPKRPSPLLLIILFCAIAAASIFATVIYHKFGAPKKLIDTAIRTSLLQDKDYQIAFDSYQPTNSVTYSNIIYDFDVRSPSTLKLPWADLVTESPGGGYNFVWRFKLSFPARFSVETLTGVAGEYSVELTARDGSARYKKANGITLPEERVDLEPGIFLLKVSSMVALDSLALNFSQREGVPLETTHPRERSKVSSIYLKLDARAMDALDRFVELALQSTKAAVIKMPGGRVAGALLPGDGQGEIEARIGLSGRTREHMEGFPSIDVKIKGGKAFSGLSSFKLYRLETKSGLYDMVFLSVLKDMGFFVPRQELVKLHVNGEFKGLYIQMETYNPELFTAQKRLEGDVVGVSTDKMFFDYPYGATLESRYFHRPADTSYKKRGTRFFLSGDFVKALDADSVAKYLSMSAIYALTHGLGVDDLRFYFDPATGSFQPIPRDLNPGAWATVKLNRAYLTHFAWWVDSPMYTIWPLKRLRDYDYGFDRSKDLFLGDRDDSTTTGVTDMHYALSNFLSSSDNVEVVNRYLDYFSRNTAIKKKIEKRLMNAFRLGIAAEPRNEFLRIQLAYIGKYGTYFHGNVAKVHLKKEGLKFSDGKVAYLWNIRTSERLDSELIPSLLTPMAYQVTKDELDNLYTLTFLVEKKIFEIIEEAGISVAKKSYKKIVSPIEEGKTMSMKVRAHRGLRNPSEEELEERSKNTVKYLSTMTLASDKVLVLFLVRNATDDVVDYKLKMRDSIRTVEAKVNKSFVIKKDSRWNFSTIAQIMSNQFLRGEKLRILAC